MVPNGWKLGVISDLADTVMGYAFKSTDFTKAGIPLLRMGNLYQNTLSFDRNPIYLPESFKNDYERFLVKPNDLVMSMTGTMGKRDYGFTVKIPTDAPYSLLNQRVIKFVPKHKSSSGFLLNLLRSEIILSRLYAIPGGTKQANLSAKQIQELPAPIPPLREQRKIAKILSTWDKAISTTERLIDNSKQQKKALMQQLLTGKKRLLDDSGKPFEAEWEEVKLGELGTTFTSLTGKTKSDFGSGKLYVPYINIFKNASVDINHLERVNISENERQNEVKFGDIFFTTSSETPEEVGMSSVMLDMPNEAVYLNSFCFGFRLHSFEQATPIFMKHVLRSSSVRRSISILAQGATRYNLSKTQLLKVKIPLPKKAEQQKIASVLNNADKEIKLLEQQLADLKQEKKALMQQLLTGKRRVKIDDKEVA